MKLNTRRLETKIAIRDGSIFAIVAVHYNPNGNIDMYPVHYFNSEAVAREVLPSVEREYLDREDSHDYDIILMQSRT